MVTSPLKPKLDLILLNHSIHTSKKAQPIITTTEIKWLMFKEIITVRENHMKLINMLCKQNEELLTVNAHGILLLLGSEELTAYIFLFPNTKYH
jgi:hypothetical protein